MGGHSPERLSDNPLVQLMVSMSGASAPEHEVEPPGADPISLKAGHEPDQFDVKGILYVPVFVVIVLIATYILVSGTFFKILEVDKPIRTDGSHDIAATAGSVPKNEAFQKISSTDEKAAVKQPRLEYDRPTVNDGPYHDPPYLRSKTPLDGTFTPELRPEDLRASEFVDPTTRRKMLAEGAWVTEDKKVARIPIDLAIPMVVKKLPISKHAVVPGSMDAKASNAGRGTPTPVVPPVPHGH